MSKEKVSWCIHLEDPKSGTCSVDQFSEFEKTGGAVSRNLIPSQHQGHSSHIANWWGRGLMVSDRGQCKAKDSPCEQQTCTGFTGDRNSQLELTICFQLMQIPEFIPLAKAIRFKRDNSIFFFNNELLRSFVIIEQEWQAIPKEKKWIKVEKNEQEHGFEIQVNPEFQSLFSKREEIFARLREMMNSSCK